MNGSDRRFIAHTARLLLLLGVGACARAQGPRGGPPDLSGPQVVATVPEPFARVEAFDDAVRIRFNERISERAASGTLGQAVQVSPESGKVEVRHKKKALEIKMDGGFLPDLVYRVTVLPTVQDLFRNAIPQPFEFVFSTGAEILPTAIAGMVFDRLTDQAMEGVRVTARFQPLVVGGVGEAQGPTHVAITDSSGVFAFRYLPPVGRYVLRAFEDANRNREADFFEPAGGAFQVLNGPDTVFTDIRLLRPDTTAAVISGADVADPLTVAVEFDDYLDPETPLDGVSATLTRDSVPAGIEVRRILHERDYLAAIEAMEDSLWVADSLRILESVRVVDSLFAAGDSAAAAAELDARPEAVAAPSTTRREDRARNLPKRTIYLLLSDTLIAEEPYEVSLSGVTNINGLFGGGGRRELVRAAPPVDSVAIADSIAVADSILAADSAAVALDSIPESVVPPDTIAADTIRPDTVGVDGLPRDTVLVALSRVLADAPPLWHLPGRRRLPETARGTSTMLAERRREGSTWEWPPWK